MEIISVSGTSPGFFAIYAKRVRAGWLLSHTEVVGIVAYLDDEERPTIAGLVDGGHKGLSPANLVDAEEDWVYIAMCTQKSVADDARWIALARSLGVGRHHGYPDTSQKVRDVDDDDTDTDDDYTDDDYTDDDDDYRRRPVVTSSRR